MTASASDGRWPPEMGDAVGLIERVKESGRQTVGYVETIVEGWYKLVFLYDDDDDRQPPTRRVYNLAELEPAPPGKHDGRPEGGRPEGLAGRLAAAERLRSMSHDDLVSLAWRLSLQIVAATSGRAACGDTRSNVQRATAVLDQAASEVT